MFKNLDFGFPYLKISVSKMFVSDGTFKMRPAIV